MGGGEREKKEPKRHYINAFLQTPISCHYKVEKKPREGTWKRSFHTSQRVKSKRSFVEKHTNVGRALLDHKTRVGHLVQHSAVAYQGPWEKPYRRGSVITPTVGSQASLF